MTQAAEPPPPGGTPQGSTSKPSADAPAAERITPALWMPAAPTIAWLAFGSAETDWDRAFYFGASIWYIATPKRLLGWLHEVADCGRLIPEFEPSDVSALYQPIESAAYALAKGKRRTPSEDDIRQAARDLHANLTGRMADAGKQHAAIWEAAETLRRALARGDLTACGWPGRDPTIDEDASAPPPLREPIPGDVFSRPVTVTQAGVLGFARGDGSWGYDFETLWSGLLFDSHDVLKLQAPPTDGKPSKPYAEPTEKPSRKGGGGRPPTYDWGPFDHELIRHLVGNAEVPPRHTVHAAMKQWATDNMDDDIDARTVERHMAKLVPPDIFGQ